MDENIALRRLLFIAFILASSSAKVPNLHSQAPRTKSPVSRQGTESSLDAHKEGKESSTGPKRGPL
jgi:hypothetical protein